MTLTMANSARIKAAKNKLESADYNYKLFESKYTQFSPFVLDSDVMRDRDNEYDSRVSVGFEKEYFGGSSLGANIGTRKIWGNEQPDETAQFVETKLRFPLFNSNKKLTRMIERTFEENELYSAQLDYVNAVRDTIKKSLEQYYDFIPRSQILHNLRAYKMDLVQLRDHGALNGRASDRQLLDGEINSLTSQIQGWEIEVQSLLIEMERWIGVEKFSQFKIDPIKLDFDQPVYFGAFYVTASFDQILNKATENDTELMVLELVKISAMEKKRLARKGKWDTFLTVGGQYNFNEEIGGRQTEDYYEVGSGIVIKRFDRSVLVNTIRKADADIFYIERTIEDRKIEMSAGIKQKKVTLLTTKDRVLSSRKSLESWEKIHAQKKAEFIKVAETADNYVQSFRSLRTAMEDELDQVNEYLDTIRDFDYICGTYTQHVGIDAF